MDARRVLARLLRDGRGRRQPEAFPASEGHVLRDELTDHVDRTTVELEQLRAVVGALQEQLDRWADGCTTSIDALSERLAAVERDATRHPSG